MTRMRATGACGWPAADIAFGRAASTTASKTTTWCSRPPRPGWASRWLGCRWRSPGWTTGGSRSCRVARSPTRWATSSFSGPRRTASPCCACRHGWRRWRASEPAARSGFDDDLEAAVDHALAVEGHGRRVGLHARVLHRLLHARVARLARRPDDPREDHRLVGIALHGHRERSHLALGHVVSPAFDDLQRAVLLEHRGGVLR